MIDIDKFLQERKIQDKQLNRKQSFTKKIKNKYKVRNFGRTTDNQWTKCSWKFVMFYFLGHTFCFVEHKTS